ncbi:MAG: tetraacyldisaccharide 4'-kinase [Cytophagaceae bacterium]
MILLRIILFPFSILYDLITRFRNHLFDIGYTRSFSFETFVINVGNLRVGGTGKTPHVEYIIRLLKDNDRVAVLSRGYGRKTKGIIIANELADAEAIGDEPYQYYLKYGKEITVAVGEERALAIPTILYERPETTTIILDDAYQHRYVKPDLNILLTEYSKPFYDDYVLPAGRLRESRKGARRADIILVTKCLSDLGSDEMEAIRYNIKKFSGKDVPIFFTGISYLGPRQFFGNPRNLTKGEEVIVLAGIANPQYFYSEIRRSFKVKEEFTFKDHHNFKMTDIQKVVTESKRQMAKPVIITTEKDMVKLNARLIETGLEDVSWFYIPIEISFLNGKQNFDQLIFKYSDQIKKTI